MTSDREWRAVVAAFILNGLFFGAWASRVPAFKDQFQLQPSTLGLLLLLLAGGAIVSFPLAGALSEKLGARRLTLLCAAGYGPAFVLLSIAPNVLTFAVALFLFGACHGAMDVAMNGWGARVEARLKRSTMSIFHATFSLGAGVGAASGYFAATWGMLIVWHFATLAALSSAIAFAYMMAGNGTTKTPAASKSTGPAFMLPPKSLLLVGLVAFSASMGEGAMADWSAVFLRLVVEVSEARAALGYAVFSLMMVITRLLGGQILERFGAVVTIRASGTIAFIGLMISIFGGSFGAGLLGFALAGIGYAVVMPVVFSRAAADPNFPPGLAIASVATLGYGGMLLGPPIVGFVASYVGLQLSFLVLAGFALLAASLAPSLSSRDA